MSHLSLTRADPPHPAPTDLSACPPSKGAIAAADDREAITRRVANGEPIDAAQAASLLATIERQRLELLSTNKSRIDIGKDCEAQRRRADAAEARVRDLQRHLARVSGGHGTGRTC